MEKKVAVVTNPLVGNRRVKEVTATITTILDNRKIPYDVYGDPWPEDLESYSEAWLVGGDGTLNLFINAYSGAAIPMAVFAAGSGNDFHWMLYGNSPAETQVHQVLKERLQWVDAGLCNGKLFLNGVGIGFDGAVVNDLLGRRKLPGKASYLLSVLKNIVRYQEQPCRVELNDEIIDQKFFMISVANGRRYGGGFHVTPRAQLGDGLLDINLIGTISPFSRMKYLPVIEKGEHLELPFITYRMKSEIRITSPKILHAHIDGEYFSGNTFEIRLLPSRFAFMT